MASISIEYCAFTIAIALEQFSLRDGIKRWSVESIYDELAGMDNSEDHNFTMSILALHQGLNLFKNPIQSLGHKIVSMSAGKDQIKTLHFMDLPARARGSEIIFSIEQLTTVRTRQDMVVDIEKTANILLRRSFKVTSKYASISEIFGVLWLAELDVQSAIPSSNKRRKRGESLGNKQLNRYGTRVRDYITDNICAENESPSIFINAATKQSGSISAECLNDVRRSILEDEEDIIQIMTHPSVVDRLQDFRRKYIKFNTHEKDLVISLFDVIAKVRKEVEGESYTVDDSITANYTKITLQKRAHYSELVAASIVRWHLHRDEVRKESGRKISVEFEADVWGKLMICEFEKKNVSSI